MKVTGFTFIRNAIKFDFPILEAINSILPICDEMIVAIGNSDDDTETLVKSIKSNKIKIIHTTWDDSLREGGRVLADETNKALDAISADSDWCFYIQGDECVHEDYLPNIRKAMEENLHNPEVEGLLFHYLHFYGSYDYIGDTRTWYRQEIRVIKNDKNIRSYRDAQGFRKNGRKLMVKWIDAYIFHYGWVKNPQFQQAKALSFNKLWHSDQWMKQNIPVVDEFDYSKIDSLQAFKGTHPAVMKNRIESVNWKFSFDPSKRKMSLKNRFLYWMERKTGWRIGEYKNFTVI